MASDQAEYEIFISYARVNNEPIPKEYPHGWVTALRDYILADQRRFTAEPLRIFLESVQQVSPAMLRCKRTVK